MVHDAGHWGEDRRCLREDRRPERPLGHRCAGESRHPAEHHQDHRDHPGAARTHHPAEHHQDHRDHPGAARTHHPDGHHQDRRCHRGAARSSLLGHALGERPGARYREEEELGDQTPTSAVLHLVEAGSAYRWWTWAVTPTAGLAECALAADLGARSMQVDRSAWVTVVPPPPKTRGAPRWSDHWR